MYVNIAILLGVFLTLSACKPVVSKVSPQSQSQPELKTNTKRQVLETAHRALTTADTKALADVSTFPIHIRFQEWYAGDGYFGLKTATDHYFADEASLLASNVLDNIGIEGAPDSFITISSDDELIDVWFSEIEDIWLELDISMYFRGMGDVEHSVMIGTDPNTNRLRTVYLN